MWDDPPRPSCQRGRRRGRRPAGPRVLVLDDTEAVRVLIRRVLTGSGYQVDVAGSAREARELRPAGYDVLLIDAHLGGEPGTVLIEELRAADPDSARRCLLVTGGLPTGRRQAWPA